MFNELFVFSESIYLIFSLANVEEAKKVERSSFESVAG